MEGLADALPSHPCLPGGPVATIPVDSTTAAAARLTATYSRTLGGRGGCTPKETRRSIRVFQCDRIEFTLVFHGLFYRQNFKMAMGTKPWQSSRKSRGGIGHRMDHIMDRVGWHVI